MTSEPVYFNRVIDKNQLKKLIASTFSQIGSAKCAAVADQLKDLGFRYATKAGVSISVDDLQIPSVKRELLQEAEEIIEETEERYRTGKITEVERFQKTIDTWNETSENLKDKVVENFRSNDPLNSVYMMAFSGARGNLSQVRQLVGMRGLMADPQGEIIALPIKTNFREGLTVTEYIISSYGARKGLVDTALRTADSGYLTRRLVDVSQDVIVRDVDCGTSRGIDLGAMRDGDKVLIPLSMRLLGRTLAADVVHPKTGEVLATRNQQVDDGLAHKIDKAGVQKVRVRSPLTCEAVRSVCQTCYGWSLAHGKPVNLGEAIGIIAAQSIGEPGTQLTMRTFHTGGVFTGEVASYVVTKIEGTVKFEKLRTRSVRTRHGDDREQVEVKGQLVVSSEDGETESHELNVGSLIWVREGEKVMAGQTLAEAQSKARVLSMEKATKEVATDLAGEVQFDGLAGEEKTDRQGNVTWVAAKGGLLWVLAGEVYNLLPGAEVVQPAGSTITIGDVLATTAVQTAHGGVVRLLRNTEREIEVMTASVVLDEARVVRAALVAGSHLEIITNGGSRFLLLATPGTKVQNHQVVAELIDDQYRTTSGGTVRYAGNLEVRKGRGKGKSGYEVLSGGTVLWIPEECHEVNKDSSLRLVEEGQYVEAGTEIVKDIFALTPGIVEIIEKNEILREITIKPGVLHLLSEPPLESWDGVLVPPGTEVLPGVTTEELVLGEYVDTPEGLGLLLRPVVEYPVGTNPPVPATTASGSGTRIGLRAVQRLAYKDGERVKGVEGVELLNTQLVLEIESAGSEERENHGLSAECELVPVEGEDEEYKLQLVILESLMLRREIEESTPESVRTRIMVEDQQVIEKGFVVARTEVLAKSSGTVVWPTGDLRRLCVVREKDTFSIPTNNVAVKVKSGDLVVAGQQLGTGLSCPESGLVQKVEGGEITLRLARPYRVSAGAVLLVREGDLVQRGDILVLLVFERAKTGDIIQGLPRIEELLEARRPREACVLARRPGRAEVVYGEDDNATVKVIEDDGTVMEYPMAGSTNAIVMDGQRVDVGTHLSDGQASPHEILEIYFDYHRESLGTYEAAQLALLQAQKFLVESVQAVYQAQGIDIADKHIETIVRQMTSKVRIDDGGDTTLLPGELVELRQVEQVNEAMGITGGAMAQYTPILLGITKASLNTDSFISAASFQETTRVLTEAAIEGKSDWLRGLKENVIIGRLIPAGTGYIPPEEWTMGMKDLGERLGSDAYYEEEAEGRTIASLGIGEVVLENERAAFDENLVVDDASARSWGKMSDSESEDDWENEYGEEE